MVGVHLTERPSTEVESGVIIVIEDGGCMVQNLFGVMMDHGHMMVVILFASVRLENL